MADFTFVNVSAATQYITDFGSRAFTLEPGQELTLPGRANTELATSRDLQAQIAAGLIVFTMAPTADELASGLLSPPVSITADDIQPVAPAVALGAIASIHMEFAAGVGGAPDDVEIFAANGIPFKCRLLDIVAHITTAVAASTVLVADELAGAGAVSATLDSATTGRKVDASRASTSVLEQTSAAKGLFLRRSDSGVAGSVTVTFRRES